MIRGELIQYEPDFNAALTDLQPVAVVEFFIPNTAIFITPVTEHGELNGRELPDQHPIEAITGLSEALEKKVDMGAGNASQIQFADRETFQQKYESGELRGQDGAQGQKGDTGATGAQGPTGATGATGSQGVQGIQGIQGKSYNPRGTWTTAQSYVNNATTIDTVLYSGTQYYCKASHTSSASILPTNTTYWAVLAQVGATGAQGQQGAKGLTGPQGDKGDNYWKEARFDLDENQAQEGWYKIGAVYAQASSQEVRLQLRANQNDSDYGFDRGCAIRLMSNPKSIALEGFYDAHLQLQILDAPHDFDITKTRAKLVGLQNTNQPMSDLCIYLGEGAPVEWINVQYDSRYIIMNETLEPCSEYRLHGSKKTISLKRQTYATIDDIPPTSQSVDLGILGQGIVPVTLFDIVDGKAVRNADGRGHYILVTRPDGTYGLAPFAFVDEK